MDLLRVIFDWHFNGADVLLMVAAAGLGLFARYAARTHDDGYTRGL